MNTSDKEFESQSIVSAGVGATCGAIGTSSAAMTAAGGAGITGYFAGIGSLAAHAGCEAAALAGLGTVFAGPILGAAFGYSIYKGVKKVIQG